MTTIGPDSQRLSDAGFKAYGATSPNNIGILFNPSRAPFDDVRVRQALVLATDVDDLNAKAGAGLAPVVGTWYSKESPMYDASVKRPATNLAKAQKLVNEYVASKGPIKSSFICAQSIGAWCTALQQQWARLSNVDIQVNLLVPAQNVTLGQTGNYNANMTQSPNPGDWPEGFYKQLGSGQAGNVIHYSNPDLDKVLAASRSYTNVAQRKQALSKITRIITDDALFNPIFHNLNQTFVQKNVKGVQLHDPTIIDTTTLKLAKSN
jgi:ABC-type transport system substrate-binding protein